jgi:AraC family transcriptional regulator
LSLPRRTDELASGAREGREMAQGAGVEWVRGRSWPHVHVEEARALGAGETSENAVVCHILALNVGRPVRVESSLCGEPRHEHVFLPGHFTLVPARMPHRCRWHSPVGTIRVEINPGILESETRGGFGGLEPGLRPVLNQRDPVVTHLILALRDLGCDEQPERNTHGEALGAVLAEHLLRHHGTAMPKVSEEWSGLPPARWRRVLEYLDANLERDLTLRDLAREAGTSVFHFARLFKHRTGLSPHRYLLQRRIDQARSLLGDRNLSIADVALRCGFAHPSHFSDTFRRVTGVTPRAYRS